jgi:hypothetical protein
MQIVQTKAGCDDRENVDITFTPVAPGSVPGPTQLAAAQTCPGTGDGFAALALPHCPTCIPTSYSTDPGSFSLFTGTGTASEEAVEIFTRQ